MPQVGGTTLGSADRHHKARHLLGMRQITTAPIVPAAVLVPMLVSATPQAWCLIAMLGISVLLAATHVVVTQIIRLRATTTITRRSGRPARPRDRRPPPPIPLAEMTPTSLTRTPSGSTTNPDDTAQMARSKHYEPDNPPASDS